MDSQSQENHLKRAAHVPFPEKIRVAVYAGHVHPGFRWGHENLFELIKFLRDRGAEVAVWSFCNQSDQAAGRSRQ